MEVAYFHGGGDHFEGLFAGGTDGGTQQFDVLEHFNERLIEAKVSHSAGDPPFLNKKQAIAGHPGHHLFVGIDFADVPEARHEQSAFGGGDHFVDGGISAAEDEIHGCFAVFVWQRKPVPCRLFAPGFSCSASIDKITG